MLGEIALSTGWNNALRSMKTNPKVGNIFRFIHNNADKYPVRKTDRLPILCISQINREKKKMEQMLQYSVCILGRTESLRQWVF